jgi:cation diffusion facilitator CzcD-associated flavoprotein CzcO
MDTPNKKVCIIGAGPQGLTTLKYASPFCDITSFTCNKTVGGMWNYNPYTEETHPDLANDEYYKLNGHLHASTYDH